LNALYAAFNHEKAGPLVGRIVARLAGLDPRYMARLDSDEAIARASRMTYEELCQEALEAKRRAA
jgi:hypothetical protein